ncbi:nuclear transport factor 2 family protein [Tateyamaria omphalii]|uniref:YybH family protein n=1 Tax=Tateyamaria omphalii TaxID=299262 RepID=UPI001C99B973|nr:nuclear transport factor 2 family protein [Tateyamaria omphalii]MBY5933515.1 nuclear transport factor 2 family protein [Tateyamaria omphalii]
MKPLFALAILATTATFARAGDDPVASLNAVNDRFNEAAAAHDAEGLVSLYANDTLWIAQGTPVAQGLEGPRQLFEFVAANEGNVTHTIDHLFVSNDATLAVMIGSVDAKIENQGMDATGTYLFVLKPEDDGWEIVTDMWHQHAGK